MTTVNAFALGLYTGMLLRLLVNKSVIIQQNAAALKQKVESVAPKTADTPNNEVSARLWKIWPWALFLIRTG